MDNEEFFGDAAWAFRPALLALVAIIGGCAHTSISRNDVECGAFASSDVGLGLIHVPGDQYAKYALACGTERFSRIVAEQRMAVAAGAYEATKRDALARKDVLDVKHDVRELAGTVAQLGEAVAETEGGAR